MQLTEQHEQIRSTIKKFVETEINPHVDEWEEAGRFPAHEVLKKAGDLGFLGVSRPEEFGGMGLDWSYTAVASEAWGSIKCGGVPMAIGVHTDMATPALARFGSDELRREFLTPAIAGDPTANAGSLKIDLSKLFGAPNAVDQAVLERDVELVNDGRDAVGHAVGIPKRQPEGADGPKDELDGLIDELDELDL